MDASILPSDQYNDKAFCPPHKRQRIDSIHVHPTFFPYDILNIIFLFIGPRGIVQRTCLVSKEWYSVSMDPLLWRMMWKQYRFYEPSIIPSSASSSSSSSPSPSIPSDLEPIDESELEIDYFSLFKTMAITTSQEEHQAEWRIETMSDLKTALDSDTPHVGSICALLIDGTRTFPDVYLRSITTPEAVDISQRPADRLSYLLNRFRPDIVHRQFLGSFPLPDEKFEWNDLQFASKKLKLTILFTGFGVSRDAAKQSLSRTDVVVLCFSLMSPTSLSTVKDRFVFKYRSSLSDSVPVILVGLDKQLRDAQSCPSSADYVTYQQGLAVAYELGIYGYSECPSSFSSLQADSDSWNILLNDIIFAGLTHRSQSF